MEDKTIDVLENIETKEKARFGSGCTYCLGLFLKHAFYGVMGHDGKGTAGEIHAWYYAAADHLMEMQIPDKYPDWLKHKIEVFIKDVIEKRHLSIFPDVQRILTVEDIWKDITTAQSLLYYIDLFVLDVDPMVAEND